jgi:hypothetical protein
MIIKIIPYSKYQQMNLISRRKACAICIKAIPWLGAGIALSTLFDSELSQSSSKILSVNTTTISQESGDLIEEINRLKQLALTEKSNLYQPPTNDELSQFETLTKTIVAGDLATGKTQANQLDYELIEFLDSPTQQIFYGLKEKLSQKSSPRGWGSYFFNSNTETRGIVEVPHILADRFTEVIGVKAFLSAKARGFLLAGAHRNTNGTNTADVCDLISSVFQSVHEVWVDTGQPTWQVHGFLRRGDFPSHARAVLSDGQGDISSEIRDLAQRLDQSKIPAYVYNRLPKSSSENRQINQQFSGRIFAELGGTQNVQGIYSHSKDLAFTHIELSKKVRSSKAYRDRAADAIAESIQATT